MYLDSAYSAVLGSRVFLGHLRREGCSILRRVEHGECAEYIPATTILGTFWSSSGILTIFMINRNFSYCMRQSHENLDLFGETPVFSPFFSTFQRTSTALGLQLDCFSVDTMLI